MSSAPLKLELSLVTPKHLLQLFYVPATGTGGKGSGVFQEMAEVAQITSYILLPELSPVATFSCGD